MHLRNPKSYSLILPKAVGKCDLPLYPIYRLCLTISSSLVIWYVLNLYGWMTPKYIELLTCDNGQLANSLLNHWLKEHRKYHICISISSEIFGCAQLHLAIVVSMQILIHDCIFQTSKAASVDNHWYFVIT